MKYRFCAILMLLGSVVGQAFSAVPSTTVDPKSLKNTTEAVAVPQLTLEQCLKQALESNFAVLIAKNNVTIADNNVTAAPFLPNVIVKGAQSQTQRENKIAVTDVNTENTVNNLSAGADLRWTLFDGMSMFARHGLQKQLRENSQLELKSQMEELMANVMNQYYAIIIQHRRVAAARQYLEISAMRYGQALEKYNIGAISGLEMKQAKIDLNADSSQLITDLEVLRSSYISLYELMNINLDSKFVIAGEITYDNNLNFVDLRSYAKANNTSILKSINGETIAETELRLSRALRYPVLSFSTGYNLNYDKIAPSTKYNTANGYNWGFSFSVPIFNGMETNRQVKNAKISIKNSRLQTGQIELSVMSDMSKLYNSYLTNLQMINFETESAESALLNLDAALDMYRLGSLSGADFREIQRSYMSAEIRKLSALYQTKISEISLMYLSGKLLHD